MIQVQDISYHYHNGPKILDHISFSLEKGSFLAVLGNNGAGKSTLLKCLGRILKADSGSVLFDGQDLLSMPRQEAAKKSAFVSQTIPGTQMTVMDTVMLGRRPYMQWSFSKEDFRVAGQVMDKLQISDRMKERFLSQLSGGERQKVMLARALAQQPGLLLLDEPTSSLDIHNQYQVLRMIRDICSKDKITSVMVIHDLNLALRFCSHFLLMHEGRVFDWGDRSVLNAGALKKVYGICAKIVEIEGQPMVLVKE